MHWENKGLIFNAEGQFGWINSHAQIPAAVSMGDKIKILFSTRPRAGLSLIASMDVAMDNPADIIKLYDKPILEPGDDGFFDEHGVMPQCFIKKQDEIYLYYTGWSRRDSVPYSNWTGLASSSDNCKTFEKQFKGPVLDRTLSEPYSATGSCIVEKEGVYYFFYASGVDWVNVNGHYEEQYLIKLATSQDGIYWERKNELIVPTLSPKEAMTRPTIKKIGNRYHMWFCYRGTQDFRGGLNSYKIGYAWSDNLTHWVRDDEQSGFIPSGDAWDSEMQGYPFVVDAGEQSYLFYSGNGFGAAGMGYAVLRNM